MQVYVPQRFVTKIGQLVTDLFLNLLTSVLLRTVAVIPSSQDEEPDLGLLVLLSVAFGRQGLPHEKASKAYSVLLRTTSEPLLSTIAADRTPFGGLQHAGSFFGLPSASRLSVMPSGAPPAIGKKHGQPSGVEGASSKSFISGRSTTHSARTMRRSADLFGRGSPSLNR